MNYLFFLWHFQVVPQKKSQGMNSIKQRGVLPSGDQQELEEHALVNLVGGVTNSGDTHVKTG